MENKKIAYIIPLHKKDKRVFRAIKSIPEGAYIVPVIPFDLNDWFANGVDPGGDRHVICAKDKFTYPVLVNTGINYVMEEFDDIDYINILEFDDTVMEKAHTIISEYGTDWPDADVLAPLACVVKEVENEEKPVLVGMANEAAMAPEVAEEFGYFDFNMMLRNNFIFVNGCYIKPSVFETYGLFKENFDMLYDYEWALRAVYNGVIIRSIPKATHFHGLSEDGAFETQKTVPDKTRENWLGAARREYFFEEDREINFD